MKTRWNGSVQSGNTPTYNQEGIPRDDYGMYRCMVIDILYVDDDQNISKNSKNPEVLYGVVILGGAPTGQTLSYCRLAAYLGGDNNYSEFNLKKSSKDISKVKLADHDGDIVYVQFNQGHDAYPVIIGMAKGINNKVGAKKEEGPRFKQGYNGFDTTIDNKGERTESMSGGKTTNGVFTSGNSSVIQEQWFAESEKVIRTYKTGMTVTEDGKNDKVEIKTAGGVIATLAGKDNKITIIAGSTEILIDGSSGKISLKGDAIDLGASVSDFVTMFTQLTTAFNTHAHMEQGDGAPTSPPMAPLLSSVGSQSVKLQP